MLYTCQKKNDNLAVQYEDVHANIVHTYEKSRCRPDRDFVKWNPTIVNTLFLRDATEQKIRIVGVIYIYSAQKKIWTQLNDAFKSLYDTNFQV